MRAHACTHTHLRTRGSVHASHSASSHDNEASRQKKANGIHQGTHQRELPRSAWLAGLHGGGARRVEEQRELAEERPLAHGAHDHLLLGDPVLAGDGSGEPRRDDSPILWLDRADPGGVPAQIVTELDHVEGARARDVAHVGVRVALLDQNLRAAPDQNQRGKG
jgi:hypothetical protein